jgi:outer membrane protein OmpA-like peptidoglycan-associated protein/tetratricopeptide (TPR) repeat protein
MFKSKSILFIFLLSYSFNCFAQKELFDVADGFFISNMYKDAILAYEKALASDPEQPLAIARLAECYYMTNNLKKAETQYANAISYNNMQKHIFEYAQTLKSNGNLNEAKKWFLEYAKTNPSKGNHYAASCDFVQKQNLIPAIFEVKPLTEINTKSAEFAPILLDNKLLFSSSRRYAVEKGGELTWTSDAFNQYYYSEINTDKSLGKPGSLRDKPGKEINDAPMSYSKNMKYVAITSNNIMDGIRHIEGSGLIMDIYLYQIKSFNEWDLQTEEFFSFNAGVDAEKPFSTGQPFLSSDGMTLYFASNRPGGYGGYDLYVSYKKRSGWTQPKNLGPNVNSPGNEMCPYLTSSGKLFFSSDWHHGFGGMDIFVSEASENDQQWSIPQNLGQTINSPYDELYFIFDDSSATAWFSSNRMGGQGCEDIYTGKLLNEIPSAPMGPLKSGDKITLSDVFVSGQFASDSKKIQSLIQALKKQSHLVLSIFTHTDSKGSTQSNLKISQDQAKTIFDYFVGVGISADRIRSEGMGELFTLNGCNDGVTCSEEEHKKNRRVDFIITGQLSETGAYIQEYQHTYLATANNSTENKDFNYVNQAQLYDNRVVLTNNYNTNNNPGNKNNINNTSNSTTNNVVTPPTQKLQKKIYYALNEVMEAAIFYQTNSAVIDEKSPALSDLLDILNTNKYIVIEIGSHTDAVGTTEHNLELSQKRADGIKNYLVKKGISADRLSTKGYGESKIKNKCKEGVNCSDAEHAVNRRTEFKITAYKGFKVGDILKVNEIKYQTNSDAFDLKNVSGLQEIIQIMKNSEISVEIRSHTDAKGSSEHNIALSERRAKAVYDYLVKNGVNKNRLKYKGYGETLPLNKCKEGVTCSDAEHAINRRTDFKVIGLK